MSGLLDKAKDAMSGNKSGGGAGNTAQNPSGGQEDYGDKGIDAAEKKMGLDSAKYRKYNEQGSDMARNQFEKATGKNIPDKQLDSLLRYGE